METNLESATTLMMSFSRGANKQLVVNMSAMRNNATTKRCSCKPTATDVTTMCRLSTVCQTPGSYGRQSTSLMSLSEYSASYDTTINQRGQEPSPSVCQASRRMAQRRRTECINRTFKPKPKRMTVTMEQQKIKIL